MHQTMNYLKLIRYKTLLFIAALLCLMYFSVIEPIMISYGVAMATGNLNFYILLFSTICIAAAGFVINDYFDRRIDSVNRPDSVVVGVSISKQGAMLLHQILTGVGVLAGLWVAFSARSYTLGFLVVMIPGLLWFYSASYKRQFIIGNLVQALIVAFVPLLAAITESAFLHKIYGNLIDQTPIIRNLYIWICGFSLFLFLTTWILSLIKNMLDELGERDMEARTMPIKWGIFNAKIFLFALIGITLFFLTWANFAWINFPDSTLSTRYLIFGIYLPFAYLIYLLIKGKAGDDFRQCVSLVKFIMIIGVSYSLVFYFLMAKAHGIALFNLFLVK